MFSILSCVMLFIFSVSDSWVHFVQKMVPDLPLKLTAPWTHQIDFACTCLQKLPQMHKFCVPFWHIWFHFWQYIDALADQHTDWHMLWLWCPKFSLFWCPLINLSICLPHLLKDLLLFYFVVSASNQSSSTVSWKKLSCNLVISFDGWTGSFSLTNRWVYRMTKNH